MIGCSWMVATYVMCELCITLFVFSSSIVGQMAFEIFFFNKKNSKSNHGCLKNRGLVGFFYKKYSESDHGLFKNRGLVDLFFFLNIRSQTTVYLKTVVRLF